MTQLLTSQKHTAQKKKKKDWEHNGPEHRSNTGDKSPDRLHTAAQHIPTHTSRVSEVVHFKKQRDPPGFFSI